MTCCCSNIIGESIGTVLSPWKVVLDFSKVYTCCRESVLVAVQRNKQEAVTLTLQQNKSEVVQPITSTVYGSEGAQDGANIIITPI